MFLKRIFARKPIVAESLYGAIVASARQEKFYAQWGVPDTVDGRFDMISLHLFLLLDRLKGEGAAVEKLRQSLTDTFFEDMDRSLREMGVGDLTVGKKVRKMAEAFFGRVKAYAVALTSGSGLEDALRRNIHPGKAEASVEALAAWVRTAQSELQSQPVAAIMTGKVQFP
jgi:cytochrome b pre-mRNA-processing protein 3